MVGDPPVDPESPNEIIEGGGMRIYESHNGFPGYERI